MTILVKRSQAVPPQGPLHCSSEKGALAASSTSNAYTIKQATDSHDLFGILGNSVLNRENMVRVKGEKDHVSII